MIREVRPPPIESGGRDERIKSGVVPPIKLTQTPLTFSFPRLIVSYSQSSSQSYQLHRVEISSLFLYPNGNDGNLSTPKIFVNFGHQWMCPYNTSKPIHSEGGNSLADAK